MTTHTIPENYAIAQFSDKRWYPLEAIRYYDDADYPDGFLCLSALHHTGFLHKQEALDYCQKKAAYEARWEQERWEEMTLKSNVYPERCAHYQAIIQDITGRPPNIASLNSEIMVSTSGYRCACGVWHTYRIINGAGTIEDALEEAATHVYAEQQSCLCAQVQAARSA